MVSCVIMDIVDSKPLKKRKTVKRNESLSIFISPKLDRARQNILKTEAAPRVSIMIEDDGSESSTATEKETSELETESDVEVFAPLFSLALCSWFSHLFDLTAETRIGTRNLDLRPRCRQPSVPSSKDWRMTFRKM